ncbi:hypothetical protein NDU88_004624 [Pleurodeles waltl]|uniref:Uncharacterized protein n=1 Tax=Pleurodeles waltl TaxID=8319 RepID=A0AAV7NK44_PLEWA|nr:hypothetical protein NDU88_004624 [Pleurodeles waltl]
MCLDDAGEILIVLCTSVLKMHDVRQILTTRNVEKPWAQKRLSVAVISAPFLFVLHFVAKHVRALFRYGTVRCLDTARAAPCKCQWSRVNVSKYAEALLRNNKRCLMRLFIQY